MTEDVAHPKPKLIGFADFIERHWKPLTFVGIILLLFGVGVLLFNQINTGAFMPRDFELTGGKQIEMILNSTPDMSAVKSALPEFSVDLISGLHPTLFVEGSVAANETEILATLNSLGISGESSIRTIGPVLGELFWKQTQMAIIAAFILMSIVVFILFRTFAPSMAVVLCAATDAIFALAVLSLMGEQLSLSVLAGTLMLIGYSVDTDIVLTTELLRSPGKEVPARFRTAAKTGLTLSIAAIAALAAMYFISGSVVIQQISGVLIIGLLCDIPSTWLTNGGILRWYLERKERKHKLTSEAN
jgi:preprotein translocase subunit SecF